MRVALVGAGRIGQLHARLLADLPEVDAILVADADAERAAALAAAVGGIPAEGPDAALDAADAVVIAAATDAHARLVRSAIARRKPTFCEKPLAVGLGETVELVDAIEVSGVPFQLGFQRRFDAAYREARRLVESGELGTLYVVRLAAHDPAPPKETYISASGGIFADAAIHDFDLLRWLTGSEVAEVYADGAVRGFEMFGRYGDVDTAVATVRMADGTLGVLTVARHDPRGYDIRTELYGSRDSIAVGLGPRTPLRSLEPDAAPSGAATWSDFLVRFAEAYRAELVAFVRVAGGESPSSCTARDGLEAMRAAVAATRSLAEHRPVRPGEVTA